MTYLQGECSYRRTDEAEADKEGFVISKYLVYIDKGTEMEPRLKVK